jgi:hypothetical protein
VDIVWIGGHFVDGSLRLYLPYAGRDGVFVDIVGIGGHFVDRSLRLNLPYTGRDVEFLGSAAISSVGAYVTTYLTMAGM